MKALDDPLATSRVVETLRAGLVKRGLTIEFSHDFERFDQLKRNCRDGQASAPMFDPAVTNVDSERAFWLALHNASGAVCAIQAFRTIICQSTMRRGRSRPTRGPTHCGELA